MNQSLPPNDQGAAALLPDNQVNDIGDLRWLRWWYRLSLPARPGEGATFSQQDTYRRAHLACILLLMMLIIMSFAILVSSIAGKLPTTIIALAVLGVLIVAVILNRLGWLILEGILIVGLYTIGIALSFVLLPRLTVGNIIQYDLLSVAILLAITFFPPWSVFLVAIFNCAFIVISLHLLSYDPMLQQMLASEGEGRIVTRPISLIAVITIITYLWARSNHYALQRADRAEMIARLQYDLAERDAQISSQNMQMEQSIQTITDVLTTYSNGNLRVRIPLTQNNVLWNISGPINNLLNRVQNSRQLEVEHEQMRNMLIQMQQENNYLRNTYARQAGPDAQTRQ
ncbi:hypothetical protein KDA_42730 [Dictyobacter alpinus]|uniref:HAMP domain-containing protein n=1 Tax=Dictyobacter alpinus TaxID=2014873 RepID=A0A402BBS5_9CHLR|nr:hypothetical protein [Dictyobacter alpinus]GCE28789.1 hypothetical protein KDA_42730 [Dictyobacter alpinus]